MYDTSLSKIYQGYGAMRKENKRCIHKKGMSHASACQKQIIKDAYPKKVCHRLRHVKKKIRKEKDSPLSKKKEKGEMVHTKGVHTPSTKKNIHTLAHLNQGL